VLLEMRKKITAFFIFQCELPSTNTTRPAKIVILFLRLWFKLQLATFCISR